jgi:hypothetical protein
MNGFSFLTRSSSGKSTFLCFPSPLLCKGFPHFSCLVSRYVVFLLLLSVVNRVLTSIPNMPQPSLPLKKGEGN